MRNLKNSELSMIFGGETEGGCIDTSQPKTMAEVYAELARNLGTNPTQF